MDKWQQKTLRQGFKKAEAITRKSARTFYFTSRFLPAEKRRACYSIYALCRLSDDAVDERSSRQAEALTLIRAQIQEAYGPKTLNDPLLLAFRQTVKTYDIPQKYFNELLDGMAMDLTIARYATFNDLFPYCYKAAGVIGLILIKVFGYEELIAEKYAVDLGVAMQLANILRDIKEDHVRGRVYIPQDDLAKHGVTDAHLAQGLVDEQFYALMRAQIARAQGFFEQASYGLELITNRRCRFVAFLMLNLYAGILSEIQRRKFDVFRGRASLSLPRKLLKVPVLVKRFFFADYLYRP